jgi:Cu(I)/Ag(I) efflux system membrane fusion protein
MSHSAAKHLWALSTVLAVALVGCSAEQKANPGATTVTPSTQTSPVQPVETSAVDAEVSDALAGLSPEDRALAEVQKRCPVSDELLGSMGTPVKVTVEGREAFVCCEGCIDELKNNFAKYEDKLPERS